MLKKKDGEEDAISTAQRSLINVFQVCRLILLFCVCAGLQRCLHVDWADCPLKHPRRHRADHKGVARGLGSLTPILFQY